MDCSTAARYVSVLYDTEPVPEDARNHILHCAECQIRLEEYARLTAEIRLIAAQKEDFAGSLELPAFPVQPWFLRRLGSSVRIPRFAVALTIVALIFVSFGWIHSAVHAGISPAFRAQFLYPGLGSTEVLSKAHESNTFVQYAQTGSQEYLTLAATLEVIDIQDGTVHLRLKADLFRRKLTVDEAREELKRLPFQDVAYVPGQNSRLAVTGGEYLTLKGSIVRDTRTQSQPASLASLIPQADEIVISSPVLIRDHELVGLAPQTAARIQCHQPECGVWLYLPQNGLFIFSRQQLQDAVRGTAAMSQLHFNIGDHQYALYSGIPINGGDQPADIWVRYDASYLPSQHGAAAGSDNDVSLGSGEFSGLYATSHK